ncbi:MAG: nucleoside hydrolase, partial [Actinomycetota bacterium]|nr:nucleoside hydrolase [Actinomycetota bacterium]
VLLALIGLVVGGCADSAGTGGDDDTTYVVVDSDGAFDDIKAILYLLEQPDVEILALTMSGTGIAHCPAAAENTSAILERIGAPDIPVACGRSTPLAGDNQAPQAWRDSADTLGNVALPEPRPLAEAAAPELLADAIGSADRDVVLVALGPLTNVAEAIETNPNVLDRVEMVYLMGGAVDVGGNVIYAGSNADAEFNIWADPRAAAIVFGTAVPITLVPLDATNDLPVTPYLYDAVTAHRDTSPTSQFVADYLDDTPLFGGIYHWDELAAVVATDESVVTIEERTLAIDEEGGNQAGATVDSPDGRPVRVAVAADRDAFEDHFYAAIIGTSNPGVPAWQPDAVLTWDGTTCTYEGPDPLPDDLVMRIDNNSAGFIALITGIYNEGTTAADLDAYQATGNPGTPPWWLQRAQFAVPAGAHDVWVVRGGASVTGVCFIDEARFWEVVGPRLRE